MEGQSPPFQFQIFVSSPDPLLLTTTPNILPKYPVFHSGGQNSRELSSSGVILPLKASIDGRNLPFLT